MMGLEILVLVLYGLCLAFILGFSLTQWQLTRLATQARQQPQAPPPRQPNGPA
ncbi:hypothetical protein [Hymenobacter busanensis]|uniref:hypothetical protein n=1 Tax=Hymenobacter busanensis TaxID=2607656 RepID=UPI001F296091|nr:hypothetical protein [Hymenobacter busanensis]